jgi:hypothetical protein
LASRYSVKVLVAFAYLLDELARTTQVGQATATIEFAAHSSVFHALA